MLGCAHLHAALVLVDELERATLRIESLELTLKVLHKVDRFCFFGCVFAIRDWKVVFGPRKPARLMKDVTVDGLRKGSIYT